MRDVVELEISRAGSYPQGEITMEDLEEIARAYDPLLHEAPLVLDHAPPGEEHRGPAYGWVKELKRLGDTLVARISQVPAELKELVSSGRYKHRSAEVYLDFQGTGKKYLKRVALLGAAIPAVKGLEPIKLAEPHPAGASSPGCGGPSMTVDFEQLTQAEEEDRMGTTNNERLEKLGEAAVAKVVGHVEDVGPREVRSGEVPLSSRGVRGHQGPLSGAHQQQDIAPLRIQLECHVGLLQEIIRPAKMLKGRIRSYQLIADSARLPGQQLPCGDRRPACRRHSRCDA